MGEIYATPALSGCQGDQEMQATRKFSMFPGLSAKRRDNIERRGNNHDILTALTSTEFSQKFNIDYQKVEVFLFHAFTEKKEARRLLSKVTFSV